ncbi:Acyl-CoA N-acyltransferase [Penicillium atrosanguineum]|nr:Acyl-CoA N-acyltransferase [Penicillium atrosanguineum]
MAQDYLKKPPISEDEAAPEKKSRISVSQDSDIHSTDAGTVVFLYPPAGYLSWSLNRILLTCKVWLLELFNPALDEGCKEKRVDKLMAANRSSAQALQKQYSKQKLWYLEVIAVHPALQSRGLGGGVMRWILERVGEQPIYLECTARENVSFYEAFGFRVVEEVELMDDDDGEKLFYWVMIRT